MTIRVGTNGLGLIGMLTTNAHIRSGDTEVVAVNVVMPMENSTLFFEGGRL